MDGIVRIHRPNLTEEERSNLMTDKQCVDKYFEFLHAINKQGYSQHLMEIASNMFVVVPKGSKEFAMNEFIKIANLGLPERDYHYEISQVFKELMGY